MGELGLDERAEKVGVGGEQTEIGIGLMSTGRLETEARQTEGRGCGTGGRWAVESGRRGESWVGGRGSVEESLDGELPVGGDWQVPKARQVYLTARGDCVADKGIAEKSPFVPCNRKLRRSITSSSTQRECTTTRTGG